MRLLGLFDAVSDVHLCMYPQLLLILIRLGAELGKVTSWCVCLVCLLHVAFQALQFHVLGSRCNILCSERGTEKKQ